ncbi:MAG: hypothetical protein Q8P46_06970 [Hyphomicrobiales bacterium]|nr:hypothetical protein [Hyphomicrobiales bacterium]
MTVTTQVSDQIANTQAVPEVKNKVSDLTGKVRFARFDFTQVGAGDAASTVDLVKMPHGRIRIVPILSRLVAAAFGAARTLDVGHTGYTKVDGEAVNASVDFVLDGLDVSGATSAYMGTGTNGVEEIEIESKSGFTLQAKVAGGTIPAGTTLSGWIAYVKD